MDVNFRKEGAAEARGFVGESLCRLKKYAEAETVLIECYAMMTDEANSPPASPRSRAEAAQRLADLYAAMSRPNDAEHWRNLAAAQLSSITSRPSDL